MYRVEINNLTKYYGENLVLDDVNLNVEEHEVVCLIGASGSGKSTLLRCINDLVEFDSGEIKIDGISIHSPELPPATDPLEEETTQEASRWRRSK